MQIACPACAATYEFDERRVGPEGIALRCSACGHLFQYARLEAAVVSGLRVRRARTGEVSIVPDEHEVRRAILERRFERGDLVSRSGLHWVTLGESPDYAAYFRVADEMGPVRPAVPARAPLAPGQTRELDAVVDLDVAPSRAGATRAMHASGATPRDMAVVAAPPAPSRSPSPRPAQRPASVVPPPPVAHPARPRLETAHIAAAGKQRADRYTLGDGDLPLDNDSYELGGSRGRKGDWTEAGLEIPDTAPVRRPRARSTGPGVGPALVLGAAIVLSTCMLLWFAVPSFRSAVGATLGLGPAPGAPTAPLAAEPQTTPAAPSATVQAAAPTPAAPAPEAPAAAAPPATPRTEDTAATALREAQAPAPAPAASPAPSHPDAPRLADLEPVNPPPRPAAPPPPADTVDTLLRRGNDALGAGNLELALAAFSDAAERFDRAEAHVGMARTFVRMGREELALVRYERATQANARYQPAWLEYGDLLRDRGDAAEAIAAYERVLAIRDAGTAAERARAALSTLRAP